MTLVTKVEFHKHPPPPPGESELYSISLSARDFQASTNAYTGTQNIFSASLEAALSQLFSLPIHLSYSREILFRNASGEDTAEFLQYSCLSQPRTFRKFKLTGF